jgi:lysophospholipase L1-like esterase
MKRSLSFLLGAWCAAVVACVSAGAAAELTPKEKAKAKRDAMVAQVPDVPGLPRVLLVGDSISMGYTVKVRERLKGKANVHRPPENCFESGNGLKKLDTWLGAGRWDVIHFNFGLHDNKYVNEQGVLTSTEKGKVVTTPEQYEKNLREFVARAAKTGATLIFATTTPVPAKSNGRVEGSELTYNEAGWRVMKEAGVAVNDLHAFVAKHADAQQLPSNVHFTERGYDQLAAEVAAKIEVALAKRR